MKLKRPHKDDKIRMIFFSTGGSEIRQFDISLQRVVLFVFLASVTCAGIFMGSVTICDSLYQSKTAAPVDSKKLSNEVHHLETNIEKLNDKLVQLEEETEDLEVLVGLSSTDSSEIATDQAFNDEQDIVMASLPIDYDYQTEAMAEYLNSLEARINQALSTQGVIEDKFLQTERAIKRIPSIRPVQGGRITDKFGHRKDPFVERVKHHNGIDLSARYGTKVFAAASGVVEFTRIRYRLNRGYGRVVVINHKNGYKTLYGHLSKVLVKRGQKVERWDLIGLSGNTGRATGPHLHYEVWQNGHPENPENYILN
ncbi:M23 family metallopeptidase [candidate division KSB1 bacterium]|nr:M23 family metallopeptidase [candidate division KSB1 bacterium]NIS25106.1 M23 family metallopeptidase [candidate division KSB1 bacterium]NIT72018.1 M23 family metallopeptidase [candidate division KSB1 bacterium]NIU25805.1 M23 family metallopeptidase [candidate division KSB1 bacterium]NIU93934.1 peptidoglycan DD-metalloendopeptidase family protein [candidate division KSB1 bacterium]